MATKHKFLTYDLTTQSDTPKSPPFNFLWGETAPNNADGDNGDYYFHHGNATDSVFKKADNAWTSLYNVDVPVYSETVSGAPKSVFTVTPTFTENQVLEIRVNGFTLKETTGVVGEREFKRTVPATIETESVPVLSDFKCEVF